MSTAEIEKLRAELLTIAKNKELNSDQVLKGMDQFIVKHMQNQFQTNE